MPAMISHLGAAVSLVAGMLVARRMQGKLDGVVGATCVGDGATSTGAFHEGLNMAAVEKLPLVDLETTLEPLLLSWKAAGGRRSFGDHIEKLGDQEVSALLTASA